MTGSEILMILVGVVFVLIAIGTLVTNTPKEEFVNNSKTPSKESWLTKIQEVD